MSKTSTPAPLAPDRQKPAGTSLKSPQVTVTGTLQAALEEGPLRLRLFSHFRPVMEEMKELTRSGMEPLKLAEEEENHLEIFYAAHTDYMDSQARVVFIGICPGFEQMKLSFDLVKTMENWPAEDVLRQAKIQARFGKSMRRNLIELADRTDLPALLGLHSSAELFDPDCHLMDNTTLLPYPVFYKRKNYTGHTPKIARSPLLFGICQSQLETVARTWPHAVFIPLGRCVDETLRYLGLIPDEQIVHGFPHPSGANGHRWRQIEENLPQINRKLNILLRKNAQEPADSSSFIELEKSSQTLGMCEKLHEKQSPDSLGNRPEIPHLWDRTDQ